MKRPLADALTPSEVDAAGRRARVLLAVLLSGLLLIAGRPSYLQLLHGSEYLELSRANA